MAIEAAVFIVLGANAVLNQSEGYTGEEEREAQRQRVAAKANFSERLDSERLSFTKPWIDRSSTGNG